ncbi:MAG: hypothetical protein D6762_07765 [Candidatus Neomarinimicrobiota bacterium]|nr:MAG: hypothetical protein D6762_07765 [Candidatus Neomarinimicrobiota bacterium]
MSEKQLAKWAEIRRMGRMKFIWFRGVLVWGVSTAILWSLFMMALPYFHELRPSLGTAIILFPIGGYFWGVWVWKFAEKQYLEATKHNVP